MHLNFDTALDRGLPGTMKVSLLLLMLCLAVAVRPAQGCTNMLVSGGATVDGSTHIACEFD